MSDSESIKVFVAIPNNYDIEPEAYESARDCIHGRNDMRALVWRHQCSLLPHNFNICVCEFLNRGVETFMALHHSDLAAVQRGWMGIAIEEMERYGFDAIHAPSPIKNDSGLTSTAVAMEEDIWSLERRLTVKELKKLPDTFGIEDIQERIDQRAKILLPNTGLLVFRLGDWLRNFPGFNNPCKIEPVYDKDKKKTVWVPRTVPEDWLFGHWAHSHGLKVGGTKKITINHYGRQRYPSDGDWGAPVDEYWAKRQEAVA